MTWMKKTLTQSDIAQEIHWEIQDYLGELYDIEGHPQDVALYVDRCHPPAVYLYPSSSK